MGKSITPAVITEHRQLNENTYLLEFSAPQIAGQVKPGQFLNIKTDKNQTALLNHPFGVASVSVEKGTLGIIYRVVGDFTRSLTSSQPGETLQVVGPLGNGFELTAKKPLLVGGGTGLAPLLFLASYLREKELSVLMGGRTASDLFWKDLYTPFASEIFTTTDDGSLGEKGTVMALLPQMLAQGFDCVYVCGPAPMMQAVSKACIERGVPCQVSLERYMTCGFGACLSCTCQGKFKRLKVCTDGPVFRAEEVAEW